MGKILRPFTKHGREVTIEYLPVAAFHKFRSWIYCREDDWDANERGSWFSKSWTLCGFTLTIVWG